MTSRPSELSLAYAAENAHPLCDGGTFELIALRLASRRGQRLGKRGLDILISAALLGLLLPVFGAVAAAIKLSSAGPVFFRQEREGYRGRRFHMLKFRSMRPQPDHPLKRQQDVLAASGKLVKLRDDPRVTALGRCLRRTSVDELPQLWNVLKGEMSLVGPRPLIPFMLEDSPEFRRVRALVRPGITGLWQLRDRSNNTTAAAMLPHDLEYLRHFGLRQDLRILACTIPAVLAQRGAY